MREENEATLENGCFEPNLKAMQIFVVCHKEHFNCFVWPVSVFRTRMQCSDEAIGSI